MSQPFYQPSYHSSHALIIGIDKYKHVNPLAYATNDAKAIAATLEAKFQFPKSNIKLLIDSKATRKAIMSAYLQYANNLRADDRLLVFFAGHGHTVKGRREIGFLVPHDGNDGDLSTLVQWTELTHSASLIPAKHIFFMMDACYGGLAITRRPIPPGSMRVLQDMLQRHSRQVLTAGKADEVVSDGDGARPGHSIFTSRVLEALEGAASATEGVVTANGLMAYVYDKVGNDPLSQQTPHFGFVEGDGDFIFSPFLDENDPNTGTAHQTLVQTPAFVPPLPSVRAEGPIDQLKRLISDPADRIRLDDYVSAQLRAAIPELSLDKFPVNEPVTKELFAARLKFYEESVRDLQATVTLLARWGSVEQRPLLTKVFQHVGEIDRGQGGLIVWLGFGWYPALTLMYAGGISALSQNRYEELKTALLTPVMSDQTGDWEPPQPIVTLALKANQPELFKMLPGFENRYTPRSDHMFQTLQPVLEDLLFLGRSYEALFDRFEVLMALAYSNTSSNRYAAPGRFGWKRGRKGQGTPLIEVIEEARALREAWPPFAAGLFGKSFGEFEQTMEDYLSMIQRLNWF